MKHSTTPIVAERVFGLTWKDEGAWLTSTAAGHTYEGPVYHDPHPPYTADEWEWIQTMFREAGESVTGLPAGFRAAIIAIQAGISGTSKEFAPTPLEVMQLVHHLGGQRAARLMDHPSIHQGIHAFRPGHVPGQYATFPVEAEVDLFGRVVEYERGYRAEKMRMRSLRLHADRVRNINDTLALGAPPSIAGGTSWIPDGVSAKDICDSLADRYQCEVSVEIDKPEPPTLTIDTRKLYHQQSRCTLAPRPFITPKGTSWQTSEENSKSTKSNWMKRTLHLLRHPLKSLREWRRARERRSASQRAAEKVQEVMDEYMDRYRRDARP